MRASGHFRLHHAFLLLLLVLPILALPIPAQSTSSIRPDGLLEVDGEPFFPVGLVELGPTRYEDWNDRIRQSGANLVWDIEMAYADTFPSCEALMDSALATGYRLLVGSGDTWNWDVWETPELEVDRMMYEVDELEALRGCVDANPGAVIAWANRDEPVWTISRNMIGDIDEPHVFETYDQLKAEIPGAIVGINFAPASLSYDLEVWKSDIRSMLGATDVTMFACYPYPAGPGTCGDWNVVGYPDCEMDRLAEATDIFLQEINDPGQPFWTIIQAFKGIPLKESRWQAYTSIVHGATGVLWGGWTWSHYLGGGPPNWSVTQAVVSELASLQEYLVGNDLPGAYATDQHIELRTKWGNPGIAATFAISRGGFSGEVQIRLPQAFRNTTALVIGEGRTLPIVNGFITDTFDGYEAHVYKYPARQGSGGIDGGPATAVGVPEIGAAASGFRIRPYPNPSAGPVFARFEMPEAGAAIFTVIDATGRRVALLGRGTWDAGPGELVWNGQDSRGNRVAPGVYFVRGVLADGRSTAGRVVLRR